MSELEDLIAVCSQPCSLEELWKHMKEEVFCHLVRNLGNSGYFLGPIESQTRVDALPAQFAADVLPVVVHLHLSDDKRHTAFLYVTSGPLEIHIPEMFFVSGDSQDDEIRLTEVFNLLSTTASVLHISWDQFEYGGQTSLGSLTPQVWTDYKLSLASRVGAE